MKKGVCIALTGGIACGKSTVAAFWQRWGAQVAVSYTHLDVYKRQVDGVVAKTGVKPEQIVDWLALIGDTSDNIPGIMGVGPKSAAKLLQQFGSLDECLARSDEIEPAGLREKIQAGRATAELNVELMELDREVPGVPELSLIHI